jgi:hypothetical protein
MNADGSFFADNEVEEGKSHCLRKAGFRFKDKKGIWQGCYRIVR